MSASTQLATTTARTLSDHFSVAVEMAIHYWMMEGHVKVLKLCFMALFYIDHL